MAAQKSASLAAMLKAAKDHLHSAIKSRSPLTLAIGNQSADLDSFTSSVLYAYFRTQKSNDTVVPVLNIPAADLEIRPEFHEVMQHAGIASSMLSTLDDLGPPDDYQSDLPPEQTHWILTDHNKLEGQLGQIYGDRVFGVIDHHEDEHAVSEGIKQEPRIIQVCGSCTSLVVQEIRSIWEDLRGGSPPLLSSEDSAKIAKFAMASILIDTRNLQNPDKTTPDDQSAVTYLLEKASEAQGTADWNRELFFARVKDAKNDIKAMPIQGVFRKDYKEWTENGIRLGTSSAVKRLVKLAKKAHKEDGDKSKTWERAASSFMTDKNVDLWLILTSFNDDQGNHKRELALHWLKPEHEDVAEKFEQQFSKELGLERSGIEKLPAGQGKPNIRTWLQNNGAMSRKQVAPMMRRVIQG